MFAHIFDFLSVAFQLSILATVLGFAGYKVRNMLNSWSDSRRNHQVQGEGLVAAARARAASRVAART